MTFILTNSQGAPTNFAQLQVTGNLNLTAPTPGSLDPDWDMYEGIAIYQDRNATATVQCNQLSQGNAVTLIDGVAYFTSQCLNVGGGGSVESANMCSRIIALTITVHGNPNMANNCTGKGVEDIEGGIPQIKLIL